MEDDAAIEAPSTRASRAHKNVTVRRGAVGTTGCGSFAVASHRLCGNQPGVRTTPHHSAMTQFAEPAVEQFEIAAQRRRCCGGWMPSGTLLPSGMPRSGRPVDRVGRSAVAVLVARDDLVGGLFEALRLTAPRASRLQTAAKAPRGPGPRSRTQPEDWSNQRSSPQQLSTVLVPSTGPRVSTSAPRAELT